VASLSRAGDEDAASVLGDLLQVPVHGPVSEPAAARLGALTTPGGRDDAIVADLGAGTIDVIGPGGSVVAAGAGELLTAAVAEMLGIPRASADWVKRGPCVRVDGGQRFEGEDGRRGFLGRPGARLGGGMLAVEGPGGWLPFDRHTARENGGPSGCGSSRPCWRRTSGGPVRTLRPGPGAGPRGRRSGRGRGTARRARPLAAGRRGCRPR
jgi:Actin-like ATPase involved in cell division